MTIKTAYGGNWDKAVTYPITREKSYSGSDSNKDNKDCRFTIEPTDGNSHVDINFVHFNTQQNSDKVYIYQGACTSNLNSQKVVMNGESGNHNQYGKARRVSAGYNRGWHGPMCLRYTTDGSVGKQGFMVSLKSGGRPAKVEAESTKVQRVQVDTKDTPQTTSKSGSAAAFVGLLATPRMWSTVRTTKQINDMKKELVQGHEDGLIGAWGFDTEQPEIM